MNEALTIKQKLFIGVLVLPPAAAMLLTFIVVVLELLS